MSLTVLSPWHRTRTTPAPFAEERAPFLALHREMNRVFDDFSRGFGFPMPLRAGWPRVELRETDTEVKVTAELPGLSEKDVALGLRDGVLTITGETRSQNDTALYRQRWHGRFQRSIQIGPSVDPDRVSAAFRDGVLSVTLIKRPEAQANVKRIPISAA